MPKFLSDTEGIPGSAHMVAERREAVEDANPELVPVPASVFDDDFFRGSMARVAPMHVPEEVARVEAGLRESA
jgi:cell division protein FtsZ